MLRLRSAGRHHLLVAHQRTNGNPATSAGRLDPAVGPRAARCRGRGKGVTIGFTEGPSMIISMATRAIATFCRANHVPTGSSCARAPPAAPRGTCESVLHGGFGAGRTIEESLFAASLERTLAADRQAFLKEACAGDVALRERVERLLAAHQKTRGILDQQTGTPGSWQTCRAGDAAVFPRSNVPAPWWPAASSCSRRSARAAWAPSGWPSRCAPCTARSR